jgi:hypothetical protein
MVDIMATLIGTGDNRTLKVSLPCPLCAMLTDATAKLAAIKNAVIMACRPRRTAIVCLIEEGQSI